MRRFGIVLLAVVAAVAAWLLYGKYKMENYLKVDADELVRTVVYEGYRPLREDYELDSLDIEKISNELKESKKRKINSENVSYPNDAGVLDLLIGDKASKELLIIRNNSESVFIVINLFDDKGNEKKEVGYVVYSKWLADYLDNLRLSLS